jgi:hypothetical protein
MGGASFYIFSLTGKVSAFGAEVIGSNPLRCFIFISLAALAVPPTSLVCTNKASLSEGPLGYYSQRQ